MSAGQDEVASRLVACRRGRRTRGVDRATPLAAALRRIAADGEGVDVAGRSTLAAPGPRGRDRHQAGAGREIEHAAAGARRPDGRGRSGPAPGRPPRRRPRTAAAGRSRRARPRSSATARSPRRRRGGGSRARAAPAAARVLARMKAARIVAAPHDQAPRSSRQTARTQSRATAVSVKPSGLDPRPRRRAEGRHAARDRAPGATRACASAGGVVGRDEQTLDAVAHEAAAARDVAVVTTARPQAARLQQRARQALPAAGRAGRRRGGGARRARTSAVGPCQATPVAATSAAGSPRRSRGGSTGRARRTEREFDRRALRPGEAHGLDGDVDALGPEHARDHGHAQRRHRRQGRRHEGGGIDAGAAHHGDRPVQRIEAERAGRRPGSRTGSACGSRPAGRGSAPAGRAAAARPTRSLRAPIKAEAGQRVDAAPGCRPWRRPCRRPGCRAARCSGRCRPGAPSGSAASCPAA